MVKRISFGFVFLFAFACLNAQVSRVIHIPNISGYETLKCDFHIHTVFSDGLVWPTVRVDEAYREGLDAIALTEHIEYRPHIKDINASHGRSYEIAEKDAKANNILLIRGSEITRSMPPGHSNAIFLKDCDKIDQKDWHNSFKEAKSQGAFIFWNHPGWSRQQPDSTLWWKEHTELYKNGCMNGIEVANGSSYFPEAHRWCLEKNLTMLGNSDIHQPIMMDIDLSKGKHRTMTLVFAKEHSLNGIREALDNRRTAVWVNDLLIGQEQYLREIFEKSVEVVSVDKKSKSCRITIKNNSDLTFNLKKGKHDSKVEYFRTYSIEPQSRCSIMVYYPDNLKDMELNFEITNLLVQPNKGLDYSYRF